MTVTDSGGTRGNWGASLVVRLGFVIHPQRDHPRPGQECLDLTI
jgi:hypothetical protein